MKLNTRKTLVLSSSDVKRIVLETGIDSMMALTIESLRKNLLDLNVAEIHIPSRKGFSYTTPTSGLIEWMPLYKSGDEVLLKVVGYHPDNARRFHLPTIISTISVYDTQSGHLSALIDGGLATAIRTGAASAVASEVLAHEKSEILGLIGCGTQAVTQLHALSQRFDLERVMMFDVDPEAQYSFEDRCAVLAVDIDFQISSIEEIVRKSDIISTSTSVAIGEGPLFADIETKSHLHINAVGSDFPGKVEIPFGFLEQSFVCPDFIDQAMVEGECQQLALDAIGCDFAEAVQNSKKYEYVQHERSVFDSTGWALEDKVITDLLLERALELGVGQELSIENMPKDTRNPYDFFGDNVFQIDVEKIRESIDPADLL